MNPEVAAAIFKEMLMTPVAELDQLPRRCGLQATPRPDDLEHARELLRAIVVGLQSGSGPNWDPIHTAWGAMVGKHGAVQVSAMGPDKPTWVRHVPDKPSLGDVAPGASVAPPAAPMAAAPQPAAPLPAAPLPAAPMPAAPMPAAPMPAAPMGQLGYSPSPDPYGPPPGGPPPAAPVPMGQPPMPMGPIDPNMPVPSPIPAHLRGPRPVARTEPGTPLAPPPPGREAWPQPPAALHSGAPIAPPVGFVPPDAAPVYAPPEGYPVQQQLAPAGGYPPAGHAAPPAAGSHPGAGYAPAGYPGAPAQHPSYPSQPVQHAVPQPQQPVQPSAPPVPQPSAPPPGRPAAQTSQGDDIAMSVAKYAMFCAACAARPESVFQTMVEFGVNSPQARETLDESWQDRFDEDPDLQAQWEKLFAQFRGQYG